MTIGFIIDYFSNIEPHFNMEAFLPYVINCGIGAVGWITHVWWVPKDEVITAEVGSEAKVPNKSWVF